MTREEVNKYAEELKRFIGEISDSYSCDVKVYVDTIDAAIEVLPGEANWTKTLHHTTEIVDFCRGHKLDFWVSAEMENGKPYPYVHIF